MIENINFNNLPEATQNTNMKNDKETLYWLEFIKRWEHLPFPEMDEQEYFDFEETYQQNIDEAESIIEGCVCIGTLTVGGFALREFDEAEYNEIRIKALQNVVQKKQILNQLLSCSIDVMETIQTEYQKVSGDFYIAELPIFIKSDNSHSNNNGVRIPACEYEECKVVTLYKDDITYDLNKKYKYNLFRVEIPSIKFKLDIDRDKFCGFDTEEIEYLIGALSKAYYCSHLYSKIQEFKQSQQLITEITPTKTKILFLTANPRDEVHLGLEREVRKVMNTLNGATNRHDFELISEPAVGIPDIIKAMQRKPEIVHFSGHGNIEGLAVENDSGDSDLFPIAGLDRMFNSFKKTTKCVILNACDSKKLAETISKHGIHVVGMNDEIGDEAARKFSIGFYQGLGLGNTYELAFEMGMIHISNEYDDANTPELWFNGERIKN